MYNSGYKSGYVIRVIKKEEPPKPKPKPLPPAIKR
jgi:hypothetical protein